MRLRLVYFFWLSTLPLVASPLTLHLADSVSIEPVFFGMHRTDGGTWMAEERPINFAGWGVRGTGHVGRWELSAELVLMRFFGLRQLPNRLSPEQGFSRQAPVEGNTTDLDTDYTTVMIAYQAGGFVGRAGKYSQNWGPGIHSLTISEKPPPYPQFGFDWDLGRRLRFRFTHADLRSGIQDENRTSSDPVTGTRRLYLSRYLVAHRLEIDLPKGFTLALNEAVVYSERGVETIYLLPFVSFWSAQHYLGDLDNTQISVDLTWKPTTGLRLYGVLLITEWRPKVMFEKANRNWFAWQGGAEVRSLVLPDDRLALEGSWTDHRVYRHKFPVNDFYSHDYPVGHWMGPHAQSLLLAYDFDLLGFHWLAAGSYVKRGELTDSLLYHQYRTIPDDRFSGETETRRSLQLTMARRVWDRLWIELGLSRYVWDNAGFVPTAAKRLEDIEKFTFNAGFYFNFDLPGYDITRLLSGDKPIID